MAKDVKKDPLPLPPAYGPDLAKIMAESARLKRQSAELLKRIAELDEQIAERLPTFSHPQPRKPWSGFSPQLFWPIRNIARAASPHSPETSATEDAR
jgi:hypothetical protein